MTPLTDYFKSLTASKKDRIKALDFVKKQPELLPDLFHLTFSSNVLRENRYAAWTVELFVLEDLNRFTPYLDLCIDKMVSISDSSVRRSISKCLWYYLKEKDRKNGLNINQKKKLVNSALDWVITEQKTAPLSFTIKTLVLFQEDFPELKNQLKDLLLESKRVFPKGLYPTFKIVFKN